MSLNNQNNPQIFPINLGTVSSTKSLPALHAFKKLAVIGFSIADQAGVAADNTNFLTITLQDGATVLATIDTRAANDGALTALVAKLATMTEKVVAKGDDLKIVVTVGGTGALTLAEANIYAYVL